MTRLVAALEKDYKKNDAVVVVASKRTHKRKEGQAQREQWRSEGKTFPNDKWAHKKEEAAMVHAAKAMSLTEK
jgi:hypothetical protein